MNNKKLSMINQSILIPISNPELPLHFNLAHPARISNQAHQTLADILDLVVVVEETNMLLDGGRGVMPVQSASSTPNGMRVHITYLSLAVV